MARRTPEPPEGEDATLNDPLPPGATANDDESLEEMTVAELKAEADRVGADPEGSGQDGRVLKEDLIEAIASTPEPPAGRPPLADVAQAAVPNLTVSED